MKDGMQYLPMCPANGPTASSLATTASSATAWTAMHRLGSGPRGLLVESTYTLAELLEDWRKIDVEKAQGQLRGRHRSWKDGVIQRIITQVKVDRVQPTFTTPPLPTWEKDGCVLLGDAAHALQPSSGQGASVALEDSEALAR